MNNQEWALIDTETTGLTAPIFVVELGAQRMRGWLPDGPPFRRLLNQNLDIPPASSRVQGYTREILERDGEPAAVVYRDFAFYAGSLPLGAQSGIRPALEEVFNQVVYLTAMPLVISPSPPKKQERTLDGRQRT